MCNFFVLQRFYSLALGQHSPPALLLHQQRFVRLARYVIFAAIAANVTACITAAAFNSQM